MIVNKRHSWSFKRPRTLDRLWEWLSSWFSNWEMTRGTVGFHMLERRNQSH